MNNVFNMRSRLPGYLPIRTPTACAPLLLALSLTWPLPAAAETFESPPVLRARDLVPSDVSLKGECYRVDDEAPTDGFLASYTLRSDFGTVVARGPGVLRMRIGEVNALAQLETMEAGDVFADALKRSANSFSHSVVNVVTNPVEVAKGIPAGVGRFFGRVARGAKTATQKLGDVLDEGAPGAPRGAPAATNETNVAVAGGVAAAHAAVDYLSMEERMADFVHRENLAPRQPTLLVTGRLSPRTRAEMEKAGWRVRESYPSTRGWRRSLGGPPPETAWPDVKACRGCPDRAA